MKCPHCEFEISEHLASHCLDAWVATAIFGATTREEPQIKTPVGPIFPLPYSTDIAAAWRVVEKMCGEEVDDNMLTLKGQGPDEEEVGWWWAKIAGVEGKDYIGEAPTAPLAICRAAIKAVNDGR